MNKRMVLYIVTINEQEHTFFNDEYKWHFGEHYIQISHQTKHEYALFPYANILHVSEYETGIKK